MPFLLHLEPLDLLEHLRFLGLPLVLAFGLLAPGKHLACSVLELPLPLSHLDRVDGMVGSDLLDRLAATDLLHGDSGLELGAVGPALAHR